MKNNKIKYFTSNFFSNSKIKYGFFTRNGGCSSKPFYSLNCSYNNNDYKKNVFNNIISSKKILDLEKTKLKLINQIHGAKIKIINNRNISEKNFADGIITTDKDISLGILTADCAPIFLINPTNQIICALHAGWKGCLNNIISNGVKKMTKSNIPSKNIVAIIGPCLNQKNFEVDKNFIKKFIKKNPTYEIFFKVKSRNNKIFFNMRKLIEFQLIESSIKKVLHINLDTYSEESLFFSHRRENHRNSLPTGRMINIIGFKQ